MTPTKKDAFSASVLLLFLSFIFVSCSNAEEQTTTDTPAEAATPAPDTTTAPVTAYVDTVAAPVTIADAATIRARKQVPVLCYHQIRDWRPRDSKRARDYIVPVANFQAQIKMLADSGYQTILPDQLLAYLTTGAPLPPKPVMLTFDDTCQEQFTVAAPTLEQYGFKGVFFVMTVSLGRPRYMTRAQVKELAEAGHEIGSHTWDHHNVKKYEAKDWVTQIEKPNRQLEEITGKPVRYFAYPFGLWNEAAIPELKSRGMQAAFQLASKKFDEQEPLFTIRRIIASGYWGPQTLQRSMIGSFD